MFFRRKSERNIPEPRRMPITLVQGYEVFTDYVSGLSLIQFSVPYHEWRKLISIHAPTGGATAKVIKFK